MPQLSSHKDLKPVKLLGMGDPGTGKTGSLVELINSLPRFGIKRVIIHDFDDGLDILSFMVKPEKQELVFFDTFRDELKATQMGVDFRSASAFTGAMASLNNWKKKDEDLGSCRDWDKETLFVCDTITGLGDACIGFSKEIKKVEDDWRAIGEAMKQQDRYIQLMAAMKCHVIVFSHVRFMGGGGKKAIVDKHGQIEFKEVDSIADGQAYPSALGRQLPPNVGRHFNIKLEWKLVGKHRKVRTVPEDRMALKLPIKMSEEIAQETALVEVFKAYLER